MHWLLFPLDDIYTSPFTSLIFIFAGNFLGVKYNLFLKKKVNTQELYSRENIQGRRSDNLIARSISDVFYAAIFLGKVFLYCALNYAHRELYELPHFFLFQE